MKSAPQKFIWNSTHHLSLSLPTNSNLCICFVLHVARIQEIYVQPDQPETLLPAQSIRHETKVKASDIYLLQNERTVDQAQPHLNSNNLENRNDKNSNYEFTKMIANGILAAEALEKSLINKTTERIPVKNHYGEPIGTAIEPLPMFLTPPKTYSDRPFRPESYRPDSYRPESHRPELHRPETHRPESHRPDLYRPEPIQREHRIPLRERNFTSPHIVPNHPNHGIHPNHPNYPNHGANNNRFRNFNQPIRKVVNERQKVTKISMPPIRRDYIANIKPVPQFPVQNQPWSLQKHIVAMRGSSPNFPKSKFSGPIKISKKEFASPAKNVGFQPDSVIVEGGFTPIMRRQFTRDDADNDAPTASPAEADDYPEQQQRRSDKTDLSDNDSSTEAEDESDGEGSELLIKTFEPIFIPSPLDSTNIVMKSPSKRLSGDLQYMEVEDGEDKVALAGERHAYYLPPDEPDKSGKVKSTKLYPAGTVVTYDGRQLVDRALLDSEPDFPTPARSSSIMSGITSTEQLLHLPQFGPFRGEIPPLTPELMKPNIVRSPSQSK